MIPQELPKFSVTYSSGNCGVTEVGVNLRLF